MSDSSGAGWVLGAAVLTLGAIVVLVAVTGGAATGATAPVVHGSPANLTINPVNEVDHQPGEPNASYQIFATGEDAVEKDIERLSYAVIRYPAGDVSSCTAFSTAVFGVDRGNDDPGTKTDESLVSHQKESGHTTHDIYVEFYDKGDLGGSSTHLNRDDQIVAYDKDCYQNPSEPGWYQFTGKINGTAEDGSEVTVKVDSHYFYICDCSDRSEAESKLGPPPGAAGGPSDGSETKDTEATATATATATPEVNDASTATATATAAAQSTATASERTATRTTTFTATPESGGDAASTVTATRTAAATETATASTAGSTGTATRTSDGAPGRQAASGPVGTPTYGDGPGFGVLAAVLALLGVALLGRRTA
jgi:PGF-CTERM protein